jgi:uncharacterized protein (DUF58 family)
LIAVIEPAAVALSLGAIGVLALVAIADALAAGRGLAGIRVELPAVVRMSKDREGKLEVRIRNPLRRPCLIRLALGLPPEISALVEELDVALPADAEWSRLSWSCTAARRGNYRLSTAYVEAPSRLGFWSLRRIMPVDSEVRVYPNLLTERRNLAAVFLHRGAFGLHAQRQVGKGRDFEKLREYVPGDSYDEIHWKATARRGRPITKVFQIERTQEVYVIVDASRLSARAPQAPDALPGEPGKSGPPVVNTNTALERFVTAALVLGLAAEQQGDLFGLLTFTDKIGTFVRARNGKAHYSACRDALYTLEPSIVSPDFDELFTFIRLRMRRRALLVFLTALDDPILAESFVRNIDLIRRHHLVLVNMLQPPGAVPLFSNPNVASLDGLYDEFGGHLQWHRLRELEKVLQRRGVSFGLLKNERLCVDLVSQYLSVKQRQLL